MVSRHIAHQYESNLTLDQAIDAFRDNPSLRTARALRGVATAYHNDEMIGDDTLSDYLVETAPYLEGKDE